MPEPELYSAPRKFDLATLLVVTFAYAILCAGLRMLDAPFDLFALIAGLISCVGVAQSLFHGVKNPRVVSMVTGVVYCELAIAILVFLDRSTIPWDWSDPLCAAISGFLVGVPSGYGAGVLVGGVFLVAEKGRLALARWRRRNQTKGGDDDADPWT